jgi:hypothetical protein
MARLLKIEARMDVGEVLASPAWSGGDTMVGYDASPRAPSRRQLFAALLIWQGKERSQKEKRKTNR